MSFNSVLFTWYRKNKRDLPWRNTRNPYHIWISEIILQQTRVNQGYNYFLKIIEAFPEIENLANAKEEDVLKLWQGLGYYSRARNMHIAAKQIVNEHNGSFPDEYNKVLKLKGIGEYSAGAILSFAFKKAYPAIDGNVQRVISRVYGITDTINTSKSKINLYNIVNSIIDTKKPDIFNQALIELGALICKPTTPLCLECPLKTYCFAFQNDLQTQLPFKNKIIKSRSRYFTYFVINLKKENEIYIYLNKRTKNDIWKNLYDFPMYESVKQPDINNEIIPELNRILDFNSFLIKKIHVPIKHILTHQTLFATFIEIETEHELNDSKFYLIEKYNEIKRFPYPKLIENYLYMMK